MVLEGSELEINEKILHQAWLAKGMLIIVTDFLKRGNCIFICTDRITVSACSWEKTKDDDLSRFALLLLCCLMSSDVI